MKNAILILLSILVPAALISQPAAAEVTFDLGIKGGFSVANITEEFEGIEYPSTSASIGPVFGGFVAINFTKVVAFQPEIYFLSQGGIWEEERAGTSFKWDQTFNYIHVPLLAKIRVIQEGRAIPVVFAGPTVDFRLSGKNKYWEDGELLYDGDFDHGLKDTNFTLVVGAGMEYTMERLMLLLDVRYNLGLTNMLDEPDEDWSYKTRTWIFMAGIGF